VPPPSAPPEEAPLGIPQTRDRVVTSAAVDLTTPPEAPLRYDLDDGEPTLSGLRSPGARSARLQWPWFLAAGIALAATVTVAWFLHGF
jgi:hypothetical protein